MKKLLAILLAAMMLLACAMPAMADEGSEPDWTEYNTLIAEVKAETDFAAREAKMHQAEDVLMATGAILPIYYYNDLYMQKPGVDGIYSNLFGFKFFQYATVEGSDTLRLNLASEPDHLDPALNSSTSCRQRFDSGNNRLDDFCRNLRRFCGSLCRFISHVISA